jgi:thiol-disulfide isomerase/thioredoxin
MTVDGAVLTPASLHGQPAVVALWATTCSASRLALASLGALEREYAPRGARVVILADDQDQAAVVAALARTGVHTPVALGGHTLMDTFTHAQSALPWRKAFALPTFLVLDANGRIVYRQIGIEQDVSQQLARVRARLDSLVKATPASVSASTHLGGQNAVPLLGSGSHRAAAHRLRALATDWARRRGIQPLLSE